MQQPKSASKATQINLFSIGTPPMRAFHMTWMAFFMCFFGWFGIAPLMAYVRSEFQLSKEQIGNIIIASVSITIIARLIIGRLCDKFGPRLVYFGLLIAGSLPVMGIGLATGYLSFLICRLAIGIIGASFVITQYHTSIMFAPNVVGTANATTAGWGNLGGGITQMVMPLIFGLMVWLGFDDSKAWRLAMVVPGVILFIMGILYLKLTQDTPGGNFSDLKRLHPKFQGGTKNTAGAFLEAAKDPRSWALFVIYGACFGIELTINNIAALYFVDNFQLTPAIAGLIAGLFGLMNIFARSLGGIFGDRFGTKWGLKGRVWFMGAVIACEGLSLILFSQMGVLVLAIGTMILFSLFVQMSEGATFSVVPFVNRKAVGSVSGIVGAGGNAGAVAAGFLFRGGFTYNEALLILGIVVTISAGLAFIVRFSEVEEKDVVEELRTLQAEQA